MKSTATELNGKQKLAEAYRLAGEAASDAVSSVKSEAQVQFKSKKKDVDELSEKATNLIKERPLLSIGCAFATGWIISKLAK